MMHLSLILLLLVGISTHFTPILCSLQSKHVTKSGSKAPTLARWLLQPILEPVKSNPEPPQTITTHSSRLDSPAQRKPRHKPQSESMDSLKSAVPSLPPTPPPTPRTPSQPIKIPYQDPSLARIKSAQSELNVIFDDEEDLVVPYQSDKVELPASDDECIFPMSPPDGQDFNLHSQTTGIISEDPEFDREVQSYALERRHQYLTNRLKQLQLDCQTDVDSDFDEEKRQKCYSLSESFAFADEDFFEEGLSF